MILTDYIELNKKAYDDLWGEYRERAVNKSVYETRPDILGWAVLKYAQKSFSKISVLEIGPGSGEILEFFEKNNCDTLAIEISEKIAHLAMNRSPRSKFIIDNVLNVSFPIHSFEIIYAGAIIHLFTLEDARRLLEQFYGWLKPGGYLFVNTTLHKKSKEGFFKKKDYKVCVTRYRRFWTENELLSEINRFNYSIVNSLFTYEKDRNKKWVAYIVQKVAN